MDRVSTWVAGHDLVDPHWHRHVFTCRRHREVTQDKRIQQYLRGSREVTKRLKQSSLLCFELRASVESDKRHDEGLHTSGR